MDALYIDISKLKDLVSDSGSTDAWKAPSAASGSQALNTFDPVNEWNGAIYVELPYQDVTLQSSRTDDSGQTITTTATRYQTSDKNLGVVLINGEELPSRKTASGYDMGFTLATNGPVYLVGNYNADGTPMESDDAILDDNEIPALIVSETFTALSNEFADSKKITMQVIDNVEQAAVYLGQIEDLKAIEAAKSSTETKINYQDSTLYYVDSQTDEVYRSAMMVDPNDPTEVVIEGASGRRQRNGHAKRGNAALATTPVEISAGLILGITPTVEGNLNSQSGGGHNLMRLLQNWQPVPEATNNKEQDITMLSYRGSIVALFETMSHVSYLPADYTEIFSAPRREIVHSPLFASGFLPPMPELPKSYRRVSVRSLQESDYLDRTKAVKDTYPNQTPLAGVMTIGATEEAEEDGT
ncbi:MAG: hypothetical protein ACPGN3_17850 [Opitutales bacterium]